MEQNQYPDVPFLIPLSVFPNESSPKPHTEPIENNPAIYKEQKLPFLSNMYIASLTVVGLFIVFRFVQRSR